MQSGTIMGFADFVTQITVEGRRIRHLQQSSPSTARAKMLTATATTRRSDDNDNSNNHHPTRQAAVLEYDPYRTARWSVAGLCLHGPYFYVGFGKLDRFLGLVPSWKVAIQKTVAAQLVLFPPYLTILFTYMGLAEGLDPPTILQTKIYHHVPLAFLNGCIFWPIANGINFGLVPVSYRVPYLASVAGIWNSYLSWTNAQNETVIDDNENNDKNKEDA